MVLEEHGISTIITHIMFSYELAEEDIRMDTGNVPSASMQTALATGKYLLATFRCIVHEMYQKKLNITQMVIAR